MKSYLSHLDSINKNGKGKPTEQLGKKYFELIESSDLNDAEKQNARKSLNETVESIHRGEIVGFRMKIKGIHKLAYGGQDGGRNNQIKTVVFNLVVSAAILPAVS